MPEKLPNINLLPRYERQQSGPFILFILFLSVILLAFILLGTFYFTTKSKLTKAEKVLEERIEERAEVEEELEALRQEPDTTLAHAVEFVEAYNLKTSSLLAEITDSLPEESYLKEYAYQARVVTLVTHFERLDRVTEYTRDLTLSDYL